MIFWALFLPYLMLDIDSFHFEGKYEFINCYD